MRGVNTINDKDLEQYDAVVLLKNFPEYDFVSGDTGVVVEIYESTREGNPKKGYMVEVIRGGCTVGVEILDIEDIDGVQNADNMRRV